MAAFGPEDSQNPVLIAGMGPGGLAAAITAAKKGLPVVIVENRDFFSRGQRVHADSRTMAFLQTLRVPGDKADDKFFNDQVYSKQLSDGTRGADGIVQVKDVQAYLKRKLEAYPNVDIRMGKGHGITAIDPKTQKATLVQPGKPPQEMKFSHIVAADGARRGVSALLNSSPDAAYHIEHKKMDLQPRQSQVGTIALEAVKVKNRSTGEMERKTLPPTPDDASGTRFKLEHMAQLNKLGWEQQYFPKVRVFKNEENDKFFFSGEVPRMIANMQDKNAQQEALVAWGKLIVNIEMGVDPNDIEFPQKAGVTSDDPKHAARSKEKQGLRATAFALELAHADKPVVHLGAGGHGGAFALVGDSYKNANFFYGHGLNDAVQDGIKAAECMGKGNEFDFDQFQAHQERQLRALNFKLKMESEVPVNSLPAIYTKMTEHLHSLNDLAKKMNDPAVANARKELKGIMSHLGSANFDARMAVVALDNMVKSMNDYATTKSSNGQRRGSVLNMDGAGEIKNRRGSILNMTGASESGKWGKVLNDITTISTAMNNDMTNYFKTNNEPKKSWAATMNETLKQADKENKPSPTRAKNK